jgi:hypothetical protein
MTERLLTLRFPALGKHDVNFHIVFQNHLPEGIQLMRLWTLHANEVFRPGEALNPVGTRVTFF